MLPISNAIQLFNPVGLEPHGSELASKAPDYYSQEQVECLAREVEKTMCSYAQAVGEEPISVGSKQILRAVQESAGRALAVLLEAKLPSEMPASLLGRAAAWVYDWLPGASTVGNKATRWALKMHHYELGDFLQKRAFQQARAKAPWYIPNAAIEASIKASGVTRYALDGISIVAPIAGGFAGAMGAALALYTFRKVFGDEEEQLSVVELVLLTAKLHELIDESTDEQGKRTFFLRGVPAEKMDHLDRQDLTREMAKIHLTDALLKEDLTRAEVIAVLLPYLKRIDSPNGETVLLAGRDAKPFSEEEIATIQRGMERLQGNNRMQLSEDITSMIHLLCEHVTFESVYVNCVQDFEQEAEMLFIEGPPTVTLNNMQDLTLIEDWKHPCAEDVEASHVEEIDLS